MKRVYRVLVRGKVTMQPSQWEAERILRSYERELVGFYLERGTSTPRQSASSRSHPGPLTMSPDACP